MANTKKEEVQTEIKVEQKVDPLEELVPFYAFKDSNKYADDITVGLNGKMYRIKRGVQVMIPRKVYLILQDSMDQDGRTADYIDAHKDSANF